MDKAAGVYESFFKWSAGKSEPLLMGNVVYFKKVEDDISSTCTVGKIAGLKLERDGIPKRSEDEYHSSSKSFAKKQIADRAARSLLKLFNTEDSTWKDDMKEVEEVIKPIKDVKTDVESNLELGSKIKLMLDKKLTCKECYCVSHLNLCSRNPKEILHKKCCFQDLSPDPRQTEYVDVLNRSWDTVEKRSREMSKYDYVFPGWWVPDFFPGLVAI